MKSFKEWEALEGLYVDTEEQAKEHLFGLDKVLIPMGFTMEEILSYTSDNVLIQECYDRSPIRQYGDYQTYFLGYEWVQEYDVYGRPLYYMCDGEKLPKEKQVARYETELRIDRTNYWGLEIERLVKNILHNMNADKELEKFINAVEMSGIYLYDKNTCDVLCGNINWNTLDNEFSKFATKDILFTNKNKEYKTTNYFYGCDDRGFAGNRIAAHVNLKKLLKYVRKANKNLTR